MQIPVPNNLMSHTTSQGRKSHPRNKFSPEEDNRLKFLVAQYGEKWEFIANFMKTRNPRQCRERWINYLSGIKTQAPWTPFEDAKLKELHKKFGAKWVKISQYFPNRSDISIKNRWNVFLRQEKRQQVLQLLQKSQTDEKEIRNSETPQDLNVSSNQNIVDQPLFANFFESDLPSDVLDFSIFDNE